VRSPPFELGRDVLKALVAVERLIGRLEGLPVPRPELRLRRQNRVRTIQGSVAIEGNTLSLGQVTALLEGRRVLGPAREILEVKNAIAAYELAPRLRVGSRADLLKAHAVMLRGLLPDAGRFRAGPVGVLLGAKVVHVAPPADRLGALIADLLRWLRTSDDPEVVKAIVAHYELVFVHPFTDGNGRMARLWQHAALLRVSPAFAYVPFESVIRTRQAQYYAAIRRSNRSGDSTAFLAFSLQALRDALEELLEDFRPEPVDPDRRLELAREGLGARWFTRAHYLRVHRTISLITASRDLHRGVASGILESRGARRLAKYRYRPRR
jgi:Fic family protein